MNTGLVKYTVEPCIQLELELFECWEGSNCGGHTSVAESLRGEILGVHLERWPK